MYTVIINKRFYNSYIADFIAITAKINLLLIDLKDEYPGFDSWFNKVLCGIVLGERTIILQMHSEEIVGISILKHTSNQQKICTFRVIPKFQRLGLGVALMEESLYLLKDNAPLASVSSNKIQEFKPFLYKMGFEEVQELPSYYKKNKIEHVFNGVLEEKSKIYAFTK